MAGLTLILRRVDFSGNTWARDGSQKAVAVAVVVGRMWDRRRSRSKDLNFIFDTVWWENNRRSLMSNFIGMAHGGAIVG